MNAGRGMGADGAPISPPGVASGSPMPGVGGGGAGGSPATGPASSPAVRANVPARMPLLSLPLPVVLGAVLVLGTGCDDDPPPVAVPAIGDTAARAGATVGDVADDVNDTPKPVPVPGSRSCPLLDPDQDGVLCE